METDPVVEGVADVVLVEVMKEDKAELDGIVVGLGEDDGCTDGLAALQFP